MLNMQIKKFTFFSIVLLCLFFEMELVCRKTTFYDFTTQSRLSARLAIDIYWDFFVLFVPSCLDVESFSGSGKHLHSSSASRFLRKNHKTQTATISLAKYLCLLRIFARVLSSAIKISPQDGDEGLKIKSSTNVWITFVWNAFYLRFVIIGHSNDNEDRNNE